MSRVPIPSMGRIVLFGDYERREDETPTVRPAIVLSVDDQDPTFIKLRVFDEKDTDAGGLPAYHRVQYGEGQRGRWWWPSRVDGTMVVP